jgi:16S rRNA (cytidine1402-2'-O)-methyltransferase
MSISPRPTSTPASLFIVATPIGNLRDITLRALDVLREVHHIAAEDTRQTRKLLAAFEIKAHLVSLHAHSGVERAEWLISRLIEGESVAYVTDAGSPAVSDPGTVLVDLAHQRGIAVRAVPGPSALAASLGICGLPTKEVLFLGFLPRQGGKRRAALKRALDLGTTTVIFESPARAPRLLSELQDLCADRTLAVCRELTKVYEEVRRGTAAELLVGLQDSFRGEFTVVIGPGSPPQAPEPEAEILAKARSLRKTGASTRQVAKSLAAESSMSRKDIYQLVIDDEKTNSGEPNR